MNKLVNKLVTELKEMWVAAKMEPDGYPDVDANTGETFWVESKGTLDAVVGMVATAIEQWCCGKLAHHGGLIDDGYAGPDSGCIDLHCRHCGWSNGVTWLY